MKPLPKHLQKFIVKQDYSKYTPVDHACWRFILRQLKDFLGTHAHQSYIEGLKKTGISIDRIPKISEISAKIKKFGWRALPVSGFIPPAAFMELQSLGVLPIASDMRSLQHLTYTPAPDIVHEAAGHAPILVNKEFAAYLREYAQVARKAIISSEDIELYEAIRNLSDVKENPASTEADIQQAQQKLENASRNISHVSEAALLARMNWWTAEYGLIGDLKNPRIFGAGLLSSVGESRWCLSDKVKKIPLTIDCVKQSYDITEPQPQLFVTPDFKTLTKVLKELAEQMAFKTGGSQGLRKAIQAKTVNTAELDSGLQISGHFVESIDDVYLQIKGPAQLCFKNKELKGHGREYHKEGFGSPLGMWTSTAKAPWKLTDTDLKKMGLVKGKTVSIKTAAGVLIEGTFIKALRQQGKLIVVSFKNCKVTYKDQTLFEPAWGIYDMAVGTQIASAYGGPADRKAYGEVEDFEVKLVPKHKYSPEEILRHQQYSAIRKLREKKGKVAADKIEAIAKVHRQKFSKDWLLVLEAFELAVQKAKDKKVADYLKSELDLLAEQLPHEAEMIHEGLRLAQHA